MLGVDRPGGQAARTPATFRGTRHPRARQPGLRRPCRSGDIVETGACASPFRSRSGCNVHGCRNSLLGEYYQAGGDVGDACMEYFDRAAIDVVNAGSPAADYGSGSSVKRACAAVVPLYTR
jgi:hypothetical protein